MYSEDDRSVYPPVDLYHDGEMELESDSPKGRENSVRDSGNFDYSFAIRDELGDCEGDISFTFKKKKVDKDEASTS